MVITEQIARRTDLKSNEKIVLAAYASVNNQETPTIDIVASMLGMDVQAVKRARKSLIEKGLLIVKGHSVKAVIGTDNQPGRTTQVKIDGLGMLTISFNDLPAESTLITEEKNEVSATTSQTTDSDLEGFYTSFGKFLANVPNMSLTEMKNTFSVYKNNLNYRTKGDELDRHIKKITNLFNEARNLAMGIQPSHKVQTVSASFNTFVSNSFNMFDKYKVSEELPLEDQLQQMHNNLTIITRENGQNNADAYFKLYINAILTSYIYPMDILVCGWNMCTVNERYHIVEVDGVRFVL